MSRDPQAPRDIFFDNRRARRTARTNRGGSEGGGDVKGLALGGRRGVPWRLMRRSEYIGVFFAFVIYLVLAVAATWPLASDLDGWLLFHEEKFDGLGALWFGEHVTRAALGQVPLFWGTEVNHPVGLDLRLADSFLFGLLYLPFRWFMTPVVAFNVFALVAVAATGAAGVWMARRAVDASWAGAFAAGLILAFNSVMHSFRVEGEIYLMAGLFLPLFAAAVVGMWRAPSPWAGVRAGVLLGALAFSSGYFAVNGLATGGVLGVMLLAADADRRAALRRAAPALLVFALTSGALLFALSRLVVSGDLDGALTARFPAGQDPMENISLDSVSLTSLLVPLDTVAHLRGTRIYYLGMAALAFGAAAVARGPRREALPWATLAVVGAVLALGPVLKIDDADTRGLTMPYAWLVALTERALAYRMPYRFLSLTFVGLAALTAMLITRVRHDRLGPAWSGAMVAAVALDSLLFTGFAVDRTLTEATVPAGYRAISRQGAVLDLWAYDRRLLSFSGRSAYYQVFHGQPVLANFTRGGDRQTVLGARLALAVINDDRPMAEDVLAALRGLGVTDIVVHTTTFTMMEADQLRKGLALITRQATRIADPGGGHMVEVFTIPAGRTTPRDEALALVDAWKEAS